MELQIVELHFQHTPKLDFSAIKRRAEIILGNEINSTDPNPSDKIYILFHKNHIVDYTDAQIPAQTAILAEHKPIDIKLYQEEIQQSWGCHNAAFLLESSQYTILVSELMARMLKPSDRMLLFHGVLQAVIEETHPNALVFKHTQQVVAPDAYLSAINNAPINRPGSLNVRFFKISDSYGDMIMDTRGLQEIGLHDLQCHYRELDPNEVSRVLFNSAIYIFENGPVIESGNTIAGIDSNSKWICQFENSLLPPNREILDLNPGAPFAAGGRK
jgi:hypothetical protein